ncbi:Calcium-binding protein E63-1 [Amphibalanus amphitrite]|uniref:Calcium-binding protein E63-1 n=1 Tax=Amphibalanus amphitrite TaxID=1232801 RepID=A0A6A4VN24_AMPAM|nr:Calcium-binding protein E63-1 [Amphibalanus amphitrite]
MSGRRVKKAYSGEKKDRSQRPLNVGPNKHRNKEAVDREPTPAVSEKELEELKMVFRLTDKNGDGSITSTELKEMLHTKLSIDVDDSLLTDLMNSAGEQAAVRKWSDGLWASDKRQAAGAGRGRRLEHGRGWRLEHGRGWRLEHGRGWRLEHGRGWRLEHGRGRGVLICRPWGDDRYEDRRRRKVFVVEAEGLISEQQFITWFLKMQTLSPSDGGDKSSDISTDLSAAFRLFDKDGNGFITIDELRRAMELIDEPLTEAELRSLIRMADADNNGKIDYEEFLKMLL